jgi:hypothetical protein
MSADRALGMVREWPQLVKSAAELWAILPPEPTVPANGDPMAILAAMGSALRHSLAAGHWPGQGLTDESWEQIAANFTRARRLLQGQPVASEAISTPGQTGPTTANTQVLHALYLAAHATSAALLGMSGTFNVVSRLVRGDANLCLSDLQPWMSSRSGA